MKQPTICPKFEKAISLLSQRWTGLVIYQLLSGTQRFNEIQSAVGISGKVLSDRLKDLENQGVVKREVFPETPVIIKYSLTEKGHSLEPVLKEIENWSKYWVSSEDEVPCELN
ncbi:MULTISPECIES: helix-turn-helix domain-containing protein [unclassified Sporosarcina]|uniref:winged helix-turn-helix transcriptional regulator n=1 Tax=unclassified Sporosarcina TaxID=2647733 RepID=UPI002040E2AC|nr:MULTISPECIES: helix-turn-helix domain-containing protein [unclassified Sporosarcina]GKV65063.1 MarR family transcriptional regulator [Sporosarcina sp. NCCP-2331]GLB56896.1 MarR family transcriptional regulator [Sporosarcina sp. NCCP-2378]